MSDVYNPEAQDFEQLAALQLEARRLAHRRSSSEVAGERDFIDAQLRRVESLIEQLRRRLIRRGD